MSRVLYSHWRSSAAYRVRIALAWKGLDYVTSAIDLPAGAHQGIGYKILNPQGLVPFLIDGDSGMNQSLAIIEYLEEAYPDPALLPKQPAERAHVRAAAMIIACDVHPLQNLRVRNYLRRELDVPREAVVAFQRHWIEVGFEPLEELAEATGGPYLFGEEVTLADVMLAPQMYNARAFAADLGRFPNLVEIDARLNKLPAFVAARPERQPDAPARGSA